jgi:hypothetical protein|nr:hypothetical protein [uncultured Campylobacter sp.]
MTFCGLLAFAGGLYGYLYGVNLLNSASALANSAAELKAFAYAFCERSNLRARAGFCLAQI